MTITHNYNSQNNIYMIRVSGKLDFNCLAEFRTAYSTDEAGSARIVLDLQQTDSIDSSALGMFLNMQRELGKADREISIINANPVVSEVLKIAHFNKLFDIKN